MTIPSHWIDGLLDRLLLLLLLREPHRRGQFQSIAPELDAVQNIGHLNLQFWMLWRNHHYSEPGGEFDDGQALFGGALFRF